jgi:hypothetical protein
MILQIGSTLAYLAATLPATNLLIKPLLKRGCGQHFVGLYSESWGLSLFLDA